MHRITLTAICAAALLQVGRSVPPTRQSSLPADIVKVSPENDPHPPILHSDAFDRPIPVPAPVSTSGGEDSPYVSEDGRTLWFWFTPDVRLPAQKQLFDGVTGIWQARRSGSRWLEPTRVVLQEPGKLALDGAPCVQGDTLWFCSAREGNLRGVDMWTARRRGGKWTDWRNAGARINRELEVGEVHLTRDGKELYFHADRPGGKGGLDIWRTRPEGGGWSDAENVSELNSPENEGWPFVTYDGREMWINRYYRGTPGVFRSIRKGDRWSTPELIVSQFAGEPTVDGRGNLYFVHHYYREGKMIEADIYFARRRD